MTSPPPPSPPESSLDWPVRGIPIAWTLKACQSKSLANLTPRVYLSRTSSMITLASFESMFLRCETFFFCSLSFCDSSWFALGAVDLVVLTCDANMVMTRDIIVNLNFVHCNKLFCTELLSSQLPL